MEPDGGEIEPVAFPAAKRRTVIARGIAPGNFDDKQAVREPQRGDTDDTPYHDR
jgi:hypothetical protein